MKRRNFITLLGGTAAWPLAARGQKGERMRQIGVLMLYPENGPQGQLRAAAFQQGLQQLGWSLFANTIPNMGWRPSQCRGVPPLLTLPSR